MRTADALHTGRVQIVPDTNLWEQMQMCMRCLVGHLPEGLAGALGEGGRGHWTGNVAQHHPLTAQ
jgi:hypothetical protein